MDIRSIVKRGAIGAVALLCSHVTASAFTVTGLTAPTLDRDGPCDGSGITDFTTTGTFTATVDDNPTSPPPFDRIGLYMVDGNNQVLRAGTATVFGGPTVIQTFFEVQAPPTAGPFTIVFYEETDTTPDFPIGTTAAFIPALIRAELTFDASVLDPDCPGLPTSTTGLSSGDRSNIADGLLATFNQVGGSIFEPDGIPGAIVNPNGNANGTGVTFAPTTATFTPSVATSDPFYDRYGLSNDPHGIDAVSGQAAGKGFHFSLDMRSLLGKDAAGYGGMKDGDTGYRSRWNTWMSGRYVDFDDGRTNADRDGHLWWVTSGLSYQVDDRTTVGAFSRLRKGEVDSTALNAQLDSDFYGGGVFAATQLYNGVRFLGAVLYESGDNDITIAGAAGNFDTDQWTVEGRIDKRITGGRGWIEPAVKVLYTNMDRDAYTDSTGARIAGSELELGRLTFGPTVGTTIQRDRAVIRPFARINGVWDFVNDGDFRLSTGAVISNADTAINLGTGVEIAFQNGVVFTAAGDWYGFDDDLDGWSLTGGMGMPFAALGLGNVAPTGLVSLDFSGNDQDASAKARVNIPLN